MDKQKIEEIFNEIDDQIRQDGLERDAVRFETILTKQDQIEEHYNDEIFEKEYEFLRNQWEVSLDYSIAAKSVIGVLLRKVIRSISKAILYRYTLKQNAVNFSNMQSIHYIRLFISKSQQENLELIQKCKLLEDRVTELEKIVKMK